MSKYVYLYKVDYLEKSNIYKFGMIKNIHIANQECKTKEFQQMNKCNF